MINWPFVIIAAIMLAFGIYKTVSTPEQKLTAKVIRKGEMANTERKQWIKVGGPYTGGGVNINLNWIVVFENTETGEKTELEVSGGKYDRLRVGKVGTLRHRFGAMKEFVVDEKNENISQK